MVKRRARNPVEQRKTDDQRSDDEPSNSQVVSVRHVLALGPHCVDGSAFDRRHLTGPDTLREGRLVLGSL